MAYEVECKVSLAPKNVTDVKNRIEGLAGISGSKEVDKDDLYYSANGREALFRLRCEKDSVTVTRKAKETRADGFEVNDEIEFSLERSFVGQVQAFFHSLGYKELVAKRKRGWQWSYTDITVELVNVEHLGWFVEMEVLLDAGSDAVAAENARLRLSDLRKKLDLDQLPLEGRYYIDMLLEDERHGIPCEPYIGER